MTQIVQIPKFYMEITFLVFFWWRSIIFWISLKRNQTWHTSHMIVTFVSKVFNITGKIYLKFSECLFLWINNQAIYKFYHEIINIFVQLFWQTSLGYLIICYGLPINLSRISIWRRESKIGNNSSKVILTP